MMNIILRIIAIILLSQVLFSCRWITGASTPYFSFTNFKVPEGTPTFRQGYKDGCSSILYARGNDFYRSRYKYRYNTAMIGNTEYRFGYSRGWSWCFQNIVSGVGGSFGGPDKTIFPYGQDSLTGGLDYTPANVNSTGLFQSNVNGGIATLPADGVDSMFGVFQKGTDGTGVGGVGGTVFGTNPLWAGGSKGWWFGWD